MNPIIIGLTSIPSRLEKCYKTVQSLLKQDCNFEYIIQFNIPLHYTRFNKTINKLPDFLNNPKINIVRCEDYGCITKLIPCLRTTNNGDIIVNCDDDVVYPSSWLNTLVKNLLFIRTCCCFRARKFKGKDIKYSNTSIVQCNSIECPKSADIFTATWGVAFFRDFFKDDFFNIPLNSPVFYSDDSYISGYFAKYKIPITVIPYKDNISGTNIARLDALWTINRKASNNDYALSLFEKDFRWQEQE